LLATRAIRPVINIWQAIMRPFNSSIMHSEWFAPATSGVTAIMPGVI
jgi:hypothetical protein